MKVLVALVIALAILIRVIYAYFRTRLKVDYSFGLKPAQQAADLLRKGKYQAAEQTMMNCSPDDLTQVVDHIALSMKTAPLQKWLHQSGNTNLCNLCLGVHYLHLAWKARTHALASAVSDEAAMSFSAYLNQALETLQKVEGAAKLIGEKHSRLIRVYMGMDEMDEATAHFNEAIKLNPVAIWPYIHYAEMIQPKWGGSVEQVHALLKQLPPNPLIQQIVQLKLVWDAMKMEEVFFGRTPEEQQQQAMLMLKHTDGELEKKKPESIHRFVLYGYMMCLAGHLGQGALEKEYTDLVGDNLALYPFGVR